jgi:hypothetical protein
VVDLRARVLLQLFVDVIPVSKRMGLRNGRLGVLLAELKQALVLAFLKEVVAVGAFVLARKHLLAQDAETLAFNP